MLPFPGALGLFPFLPPEELDFVPFPPPVELDCAPFLARGPIIADGLDSEILIVASGCPAMLKFTTKASDPRPPPPATVAEFL